MRRAALVVVLLLLGAACSSDDDDEAAPTTTTATTASPSTTTSTTVAPCAGPALGGAVDEAATIDQIDLDGDGELDVVTSYLSADQWRLRADLANGGRAEVALATSGFDAAHVETATDLDGDGHDEVWVVVGSGASTTIIGLFQLAGCDLRSVQLDGTDAQFAIGGPVLLLQGVRCEGNHLVHLGATTEDGETYTTLDLIYELRGGELVRVDDRSGQLAGDDPELQAYSTFTCGAGG